MIATQHNFELNTFNDVILFFATNHNSKCLCFVDDGEWAFLLWILGQGHVGDIVDIVARQCYGFAKAMLKERESCV